MPAVPEAAVIVGVDGHLEDAADPMAPAIELQRKLSRTKDPGADIGAQRNAMRFERLEELEIGLQVSGANRDRRRDAPAREGGKTVSDDCLQLLSGPPGAGVVGGVCQLVPPLGVLEMQPAGVEVELDVVSG